MIAIVTGPLHAGKTIACERTLSLLKEQGVRPAGILTYARFDMAGERVGLDVLDVASGERRSLAVYQPGGPATICDYIFDDEALRWGLSLLQQAVAERCDLLVVDEIGRLELHQHGGWAWALAPLANPEMVPRALLAVRMEVVEETIARLGRNDLTCITVDENNRDEVPRRLALYLTSD
jgi:nucleoside-triphosphatase